MHIKSSLHYVMKATETQRLYNLMQAQKLHKQHVQGNKQGRSQVKAPGKRLRVKWHFNVSYEPRIHDAGFIV